jgi:2-polyprenyl-6-methoxyphenol hydroxylase-like FAD-dependent oxidoreductase
MAKANMAKNENDGVLICGAGPTGLLTALGLARARVNVTVIDAEPAMNQSPRANGYHPATVGLLEEMGILADVEAVVFRSLEVNMHFPLANEVIPLSLASLEGAVPHPYYLHLGQQRLGEIIIEHLARMPHAAVRWSTKVKALRQDAAGVTVTVETPEGEQELRTGWFVGADGARSTVRNLLELPFEGFTWPDRFVATNVWFDFEKHGYAPNNMVHHPVDWAVVSRLTRENFWRVTYGEDPELPEGDIQKRIAEHYARILPSDEKYEIAAAAPYRVHERAAPRFRVGRVLLAGDAAHACNPCGGMGLTGGAFDALALSTALGLVIHGEAGEDLLDFYSEERRRVFYEIASPIAQEHKRRITEADPEKQREFAKNFREVSKNPAAMREAMLFSFKIRGAKMTPGARALEA